MNYYELLEMDTDDANVQLQLYYCCLTGNGKGIDDPYKWLKLSAENGNSEAQKILSDIEKNNIDNQEAQVNEKVKEYENTDTIDLVELANYDYYAAKELYRRRLLGGKRSFLQIDYLKRICKFEQATVEDFEQLVEAYNDAIECNEPIVWDEFEYACQNAYEMSSKKTDRYYIYHFFLRFFCGVIGHHKEKFVSRENIEKMKNLLVRNINESDYNWLFRYFVIIFSDIMNGCENCYDYRFAFFEALDKHPDKEKHTDLHNILKDAKDTNELEDFSIFIGPATLATDVFEKYDELDEDYKTWKFCLFVFSGLYRAGLSFKEFKQKNQQENEQENIQVNQQANQQKNHISSTLSKILHKGVDKIPVKYKEFFYKNKNLCIIAIALIIFIIVRVCTVSFVNFLIQHNKSSQHNNVTVVDSNKVDSNNADSNNTGENNKFDIFELVNVNFYGVNELCSYEFEIVEKEKIFENYTISFSRTEDDKLLFFVIDEKGRSIGRIIVSLNTEGYQITHKCDVCPTAYNWSEDQTLVLNAELDDRRNNKTSDFPFDIEETKIIKVNNLCQLIKMDNIDKLSTESYQELLKTANKQLILRNSEKNTFEKSEFYYNPSSLEDAHKVIISFKYSNFRIVFYNLYMDDNGNIPSEALEKINDSSSSKVSSNSFYHTSGYEFSK